MECNDCTEHHVRHYQIKVDSELRNVMVFPREPSWWRDDTDEAEQQRQHVFADFDQSELVILIDEVWMYVRAASLDDEDSAALVTATLSLSWMHEVCLGSLTLIPEDDSLTAYTRYWQQRATRYLELAAWHTIQKLEPHAFRQGILAMSIQ